MVTEDKTVRKFKDKLSIVSEHVFLGCAIFLIVMGLVVSLWQLALGVSIVSVGVAGFGIWIATKSDRRMKAIANLEFNEKIAVVEHYLHNVGDNKTVSARAIGYDIRAALELQRWVEPNLEKQLWQSIDILKSEAQAKHPKYEDLCEELHKIKQEFRRL